MKVLIVGAGISGLTISYKLAQKGYDVTLIEKEDRIGGLTRSFNYDRFTFDIGPHRFYTLDKEILKFIFQISEIEDLLKIDRKSKIWLFNKYFRWPFDIYNLFKLPPSTIKSILKDHLRKDSGIDKNDSFEVYIKKVYGSTIYDIFFKPYTEKFLRLPPNDIDASWAILSIDRALIDKRININSLFLLIKTAIFPKLNVVFHYPKKEGIQYFCRNLCKRLEKFDVKILLNSQVNRIIKLNRNINRIYVNNNMFDPDIVIWTAPIDVLANLLNLPSYDLRYLSTLCYNICLNRKIKVNAQWCYYGSKDICFNRLTFPQNFSKYNAHAKQSSICVEVTCYKNDRRWDRSALLIDRIVKDLIKVNIIKDSSEIENINIEKIENTYPVYTKNFNQRLDKLKKQISTYKNLFLLGRTAQYWYNNMDESIKAALTLSDRF